MRVVQPTKQQTDAAVRILFAVSEAVREAKEIPQGSLYAAAMGVVDIEGFEKIVKILVGSGMVEKRGDLLRWIGPEVTR